MEISIREFVEAVDGKLEMSSLPPLGGVDDSITNIQFDSRRCGKGSLFWPLAAQPTSLSSVSSSPISAGCSDEAFADHAFSNGALGVLVTRRAIEPWAGGFAVRVADGLAALDRFARYNRRRFLSPLALVLDFDGSVGRQLESVWAADGAYGSGVCDGDPTRHQVRLAQLGENHDYHVVVLPPSAIFSAPEAISQISDLCHPDIAVITPLAFGTHHNTHQLAYRDSRRLPLERLLHTLKETPLAIVPHPTDGQLPWEFSGEVLRYGLSDDCQVRAEHVQSHGPRLRFDVQGREFQTDNTCDRSLSHSLATIALCDQLRIDKDKVQTALLQNENESIAS